MLFRILARKCQFLLIIVFLVTVLGGCQVENSVSAPGNIFMLSNTDTSLPKSDPDSVQDGKFKFDLSRPTVSVFYVPFLKVQADEDEEEPEEDILFEADIDTSCGWGVRIGLADIDNKWDVGILYLTSRHNEKSTDSNVDLHSAYLDFVRNVRLNDNLYLTGGLSGGAAMFDFSETFDDTGGLAAMLRLGLGVAFSENFTLQVGGAYFLWGYPGETIGYGGLGLAGGMVRF